MSCFSRVFHTRRKGLALISAVAALAWVAVPALSASAASPSPATSLAPSPSADLATTIVSPGHGYYPITVTNNGPDTASDVVMTDNIPFSTWSRFPTTFYCVGSGTGCGPLPPGVSCTTPKVGSGGTVSCTTASLPPGASMTVTMVIRLGFYFHHQAVCDGASASSATFDPNIANNSAGACFEAL